MIQLFSHILVICDKAGGSSRAASAMALPLSHHVTMNERLKEK